MSIETRKSMIGDDLSIKSLKMKSLLANISSDYSFQIMNSSFEFSKEIMTDLYDRENVFQRRFNYFKFPDYVKQMSVNFVDTLFQKENKLQMLKETERRRTTRKASKVLRNSKMSDFFENLVNSNKKRSRKKKALFLRDNFSSIDDNFKIADDRDCSFENEFKIDEEDCEEIQRNNPFEDSFQNDLSDIILKSRGQSKFSKKKFFVENQNGESFNDRESIRGKEKKKKRKRKKKRKNKSYSDASSLASDIKKAGDKSSEDSSDLSRRHRKEGENGQIDKERHRKDKKNKKNKKKKDNKDNRCINHNNKSNIENSKCTNDHNEKEKLKKKKKDNKKKNKKSSKLTTSELENGTKKNRNSDSISSSFIENSSNASASSYSNSSNNSFSSESEYTSNSNTSNSSDSDSASDTDSSYISINSSRRFQTDALIEEKRHIEEQLIKDCEINPNDNTVIREKKSEKLKELNSKLKKLNESIEKHMQREMNKKVLETLTRGDRHKNKKTKHKTKAKFDKSLNQSENKSHVSIKSKNHKDSSKSNSSKDESEDANHNEKLGKETLKEIKPKPESEKEKNKMRTIKENADRENASQGSVIIEKSTDKKVVGFKNSASKATNKIHKHKNKKGKLDNDTSLNSSFKSIDDKEDNINRKGRKEKKKINDKKLNIETTKNNENKIRKGILKNKKNEKSNIDKNLNYKKDPTKKLGKENLDSPRKKKFDVNMKKSFSSSNKNSDMSLPKGKTLRNLKTIKSLESNLENEEDEIKQNSSSSLSISEKNNKKNIKENKKKFNKINKKAKKTNDLKENSTSSPYLRNNKRKKKNTNEDFLNPTKTKKKDSDTNLNDGSGISKLKLLKRQITQQKKDLIFHKGSFLQKPQVSILNMDPELMSNGKNTKNFNSQNDALVPGNFKNSKTIATHKHLKKISDLDASLNNGSDDSQNFISPVANWIKNPLKIKDEVKNVFETIKIIKEEKDGIKNSLDEEKSKIKKNNLINLIIEETKYINSNESLSHGINYEINSDNKPIQLKYNMRKVSNEHEILDKIKNKFIEEFKKVKSDLENVRNSHKKSSIISEGKVSDFILNQTEDKNKSHHKNSNSSLTKKSSVAYKQMDIIPETSKFNETVKIEKEIDLELKRISIVNQNLDKSNRENVNSINGNLYNNSSQSNSNNNKNINTFLNKNSSRDDLISEFNFKFKNKSHEENVEIESNKIIVTENDVINNILIRNNEKDSKLNSKNNMLPALKLNNLKDTPKKLLESKPAINTTYTVKNLNHETNILPQDKIDNLKNSQKMYLEKLNFGSKNDKILRDANKNECGDLNINSDNKENPISIQKKTSQVISIEEQRQKAQEMKEKMKIIDENKKQNFQNLIKLNIQKNQNMITFDFDSSGDDSENLNSENCKQIESNNNQPNNNNNNMKGNIINFKKGATKIIHKQESMKLKQKEDFTNKFLSPIASNIDWMKKPNIINSASSLMNSNFFVTNKTNENNFFTMDPNSNNNTKKNFYRHIQSENQIKFMSNNNLKNDFNTLNNKNYAENKPIKGIKLESNKQLLNVNNDNKNKGFHLNSFNNQKILNPSFKEAYKNKDSKILNLNLNNNAYSSFKNQKNRRSSFLGNNTNGIDSNKIKLSEVKLPNIR